MCTFGVFFILLAATFVMNGNCEIDTEAPLLALEASGELLPSDDLIQKISNELQAIRKADPAVSSISYSLPWSAGVLMAKLSDSQLEEIRSQYGEVTSRPLFADYKLLTFAKKYNAEVLAKELTSKKLVESAEPDRIIGGGGGIKYDPQTSVYTFSKGWGDCPSGCIYNHYWEFSVDPSTNEVKLLKESGTPLTESGGEAV